MENKIKLVLGRVLVLFKLQDDLVAGHVEFQRLYLAPVKEHLLAVVVDVDLFDKHDAHLLELSYLLVGGAQRDLALLRDLRHVFRVVDYGHDDAERDPVYELLHDGQG